MHMHIYSDEAIFNMSYGAKRLLNDSVSRTLRGFNQIGEGAILTGSGNLILARIESVAAFAMVAISSSFILIIGVVITPLFLPPTIVLNLASRIPGISSFESVQNFTSSSSNVIIRVIKVSLAAIPATSLFLATSCINTFLPGALGTQNIFFRLIHSIVKPLGPLQRIIAVVDNTKIQGMPNKKDSFLEFYEEYFRALSYKNYLTSHRYESVTHHYTTYH